MTARDRGLALVVLLALVVSGVLFERAIRIGGFLGWDEAYHSLWGLLIADDLARARFVSLLVDTNRQVYWPPVHSWYLASLFTLFGPSTILARASSLLALVAAAVAVYLAGRRLVESAGAGSGTVGGVAAAVSLLASGGVLWMATRAMLELPGLFWLSVSFWLYLRSSAADARDRWSVLLGLTVFVTYLTRPDYGVSIAVALAVAFAIDGRWLGRRDPRLAARRRTHWLVALALGVPLAIWLAHPRKLAFSLTVLMGRPYGPERFSLDGLLFYPRSMLWLAGSWLLLSVWALALGLTIRRLTLASSDGLRLVVIFLALQLLFAELAITKAERLGLPFALGLSLLAGYWAGSGWVGLAERWRSLGPRVPAVAAWTAGAIVASLLVWQARGVPAPGARGDAGRAAVLQALTDDLRRNGPSLLVGGVDLVGSAAGADWHLAVAGLLPAEGAGSLVSRADVNSIHSRPRRLSRLMPSSLRGQVDRWPGVAGTYTAYLGLPFDAPDPVRFTASNFGERMAALLARHPVNRVLVVVAEGAELTPEHAAARLGDLGFTSTSPPRRIPDARVTLLEFRSTGAVKGAQS